MDFKNYFVIMLVDGAGWHRAQSLKVPENIRLIYQPSHSPELNPVEHMWDELREKHLPNKAFRSLDAVERALCDGLCKLQDDPERLRSMTNFEYLKVTILKENGMRYRFSNCEILAKCGNAAYRNFIEIFGAFIDRLNQLSFRHDNLGVLSLEILKQLMTLKTDENSVAQFRTELYKSQESP